MINRSDEEITAKLDAIFNVGNYTKANFEIRRDGADLHIQITRMYDIPGLQFAQMHDLARYFGTMNIETDSEFYYGGCETCDYGSKAGYTLHLRPGLAPDEEGQRT